MKASNWVTALIIILFSQETNAQVSSGIYGIYDSLGTGYFCRVDLPTGALTKYQQACSNFGSFQSSSVNISSQEYYFCTGKTLLVFDANSCSLVSTDSLPIASNANFIQVQYSACDSLIYGIVSAPSNNSFCKYNLALGTMTTISGLNPGLSFLYGGSSILDPANGKYSFYNGNIIELDLYTGQVLQTTPVINIPGETFGHIAWNSVTQQLFGTSANVSAGVKYMSLVDPVSGAVTHVTHTGWNIGIMKPAGGGQCIDQATGNYYYSGMGWLIGANTSTGIMNFSTPVSPGAMNYIQHFSLPACSNPTSIPPVEKHNACLQPSLCTEFVTFNAMENHGYDVGLFDLTGRKILFANLRPGEILDTRLLETGMYVYRISDSSGLQCSGILEKQ